MEATSWRSIPHTHLLLVQEKMWILVLEEVFLFPVLMFTLVPKAFWSDLQNHKENRLSLSDMIDTGNVSKVVGQKLQRPTLNHGSYNFLHASLIVVRRNPILDGFNFGGINVNSFTIDHVTEKLH
ncbi:hypothetical protein Tco_0694427 [Tanacetum coccineum]